MKKVTWLFVAMILMSTLGSAQKQQTGTSVSLTKVNFERTITLENDSKAEDVVVDIQAGTSSFELVINSFLVAAKLTIGIFDPNGVKQENFSVETQLGAEKEERVKGRFLKSLNEPQPGHWKIKVIPTAAKGSIKIHTAHRQ